MSDPQSITMLLQSWKAGDQDAYQALFQSVYAEMKIISKRFLARERANHTLNSTALVHEAYMQMSRKEEIPWNDRDHFFAVASQVMRRILVDHARAKNAQKRGGLQVSLSMENVSDNFGSDQLDVIALENALQELEAKDPQKGRVVELKFYCGLPAEKIAEVLGVSKKTVDRHWRSARAFLLYQLTGTKEHES